MKKEQLNPADVAKVFLRISVNAEGMTDALKGLICTLKQMQYRFISNAYCTLTGEERNSQRGRDMVRKMQTLRREIAELQYKPVWLLVIYYNGHRYYQSLLPDLDGVQWGEKTVDADTLKVSCSGAANDRFFSMFTLLSFDEYRLYKNKVEITAARIY